MIKFSCVSLAEGCISSKVIIFWRSMSSSNKTAWVKAIALGFFAFSISFLIRSYISNAFLALMSSRCFKALDLIFSFLVLSRSSFRCFVSLLALFYFLLNSSNSFFAASSAYISSSLFSISSFFWLMEVILFCSCFSLSISLALRSSRSFTACLCMRVFFWPIQSN